MAALRYLTVMAALLISTQAQTFRQQPPSPHATSRFNFFDVELLKAIIANEGIHNFVISPASAKAVLGMLLEGSRGESAQQIEKALRLRGNRVSHHTIFNAFLSSLKTRYSGYVVEVANQIFLSTDRKIKSGYQDTLEKIYYSGVYNVDFKDSQLAAATINGWVGKNTHGLIRTLIPPDSIDQQTVAVIANALYFKGKWAVPFNSKATTERCFYTTSNTCRIAYFMEAVGRYGFADLKDLNAKALEIQYQGSKYSMIFLLPNHGLDELLRDLSYQPLNTIIPKLESTTVVLSVPRFSIEYKTDLVYPLTQLGIKDIFTPAANFSGMLENGHNVHINQFLQKAIIEVNEEGTVGAAASGAVAVPLAGSIIPKFQATRPFLFFLRDTETGNYLFEGLVQQPELVMDDNNSPPMTATAERGETLPASAQQQPPTILKPIPSNQNGNYNIEGNTDSITSSHVSDKKIVTSNNQTGTSEKVDTIKYPPL